MFSFRFGVCLHLRQKPQDERVRRMATLKAISTRLKSVKNIQKITKSMKMVSAAKFAKAERELKQARPLGEGMKLFYTKAQVGQEKEKDSPSHDEDRKRIYIAVTSDRGLCGAVHTSVAKVIRKTLNHPGENIKIVCIGDKARSLLHRLMGENFLFVCQEVGRVPPTFTDASIIANEILKSGFEFESVNIIYNRYRSVVSYATDTLEVFSVSRILQSPKIQTYDEVDEDTLEPFVEFSLAALLYFAMKEGACSEQSSRMTAMDSASKNAGDMISKLTLTFNRTRQAVITRELIEIISGASAL